MSDLNVVAATGRLTRDPQVRYAQSGTAICDFGLAVGRKYNGKEEVTWLDVVAFGRLAEVLGEYGAKGRQVAIRGWLQTDEWEDKKSGQKRSKLKVVAEGVTLLGAKDVHPPERSQDPVPPQESYSDPPSTQGESSDEPPDDGVPF
jgi:single-strand DNA-binding protein